MEKQESRKLNLSRWIIVHDTPVVAWLGRLDDSYFVDGAYPDLLQNLMGHEITLLDALVLQTSTLHIPGPGGSVQTIVTANAHAPHTFSTEAFQVTLTLRSATLVSSLDEQDQLSLAEKIESVRTMMLKQRAKASGLVLPGVRA